MLTKQKIIQAGNSLAVTIPAKFVHRLALKSGDILTIRQNPDANSITYTFSGVHQLTFSSQINKTTKK